MPETGSGKLHRSRPITGDELDAALLAVEAVVDDGRYSLAGMFGTAEDDSGALPWIGGYVTDANVATFLAAFALGLAVAEARAS